MKNETKTIEVGTPVVIRFNDEELLGKVTSETKTTIIAKIVNKPWINAMSFRKVLGCEVLSSTGRSGSLLFLGDEADFWMTQLDG